MRVCRRDQPDIEVGAVRTCWPERVSNWPEVLDKALSEQVRRSWWVGFFTGMAGGSALVVLVLAFLYWRGIL